MRHYILATALLLLFTNSFAQESDAWINLCPSSINFANKDTLANYTNPLTENYHCIKDWNPCDLNWWKNQKDDNEQMKWAVPMFPRNVGLGASIAPVQ